MKKATVIAWIITVLFITCMALAPHAQAAILADSVFNSATTNMLSTKRVLFTAITIVEQQKIRITSCRLYKLNGSTWEYVYNLPIPEYVATNTVLYGASMDYARYIGQGTYKILTTFNADGHSISRYSNTRSY